MKNILITGGTGFIGNHLLNFLIRDRYIIRATTRKKILFAVHENLDFIRVDDINHVLDWQDILSGVDCVIHMAGLAHILCTSGLLYDEFYRTNVEGTATLAKQAIAAGVKHFIFLSSVGAMATLSDRPLDETSPCKPDTPYGRSKLQAEIRLSQLCAETSMTWTILRPTLVYGPQNPGNMAQLLKLVNRGLPLPLGAIRNRRSFLYVGNLVDVIHLCINHPAAQNQTFLVSDDEVLSTPDLIGQIGQAMGRSLRLLPIPPALLIAMAQPLGQRERLSRLTGSLEVSNHHLKTTLKWAPTYSFAQGMQNTVDWFIDSSVSQ
ncbi:MAG: NAD-dependent epimerase/dehydratase family protein [Leptolyngbyaceae cyanobacterium]